MEVDLFWAHPVHMELRETGRVMNLRKFALLRHVTYPLPTGGKGLNKVNG